VEKYNKWFKQPGSIIYYYMTKAKKDGAGLGVTAHYKNREVTYYDVHFNFDVEMVFENCEMVRDKNIINALESYFSPRRACILWVFSGQHYYHI